MAGSGWQLRLASFRTPTGRVVSAALRHDSTTLGLDGTHSVSFDRAGRLQRASWGGRSVRRALDNRFVERRRTGHYPWSHTRRELSPAEWRALVEAVHEEVSAARQAAA